MEKRYNILKLKDWNSLDPETMGLFQMDDKLSAKYHQWISGNEDNSYKRHQADCKSNQDFYYGHQYTQEELDINSTRGQYNLIVNKLRNATRSLSGILTANKPEYHAMILNDSSLYTGDIVNGVLDWVWYHSKGNSTFKKTVRRGTRDNIGYFHVKPTEDGKIIFESLSYDQVIVDKTSKDTLFDDAHIISIKRTMPVEVVKQYYGIHNIYSNRSTAWKSNLNANGEMPDVKRLFHFNKQYVDFYENRRKITVKLPNGQVKTRIVVETVIGLYFIYRTLEPEPIKNYNIIPVFSEDTENPYKLGEVHFTRDLQKILNKFYGILIRGAQLNSNPKIIIKDSLLNTGDISSVQDNLAKPGAIQTVADTNRPLSDDIIVIGGQPINPAFSILKQDIAQILDSSTIPQDLSYYDSNDKRRQISRLDMFDMIMDRYKDFATNLELSLTRLGEVCLEYFKAYKKNDKEIFYITGTNNEVKRLQINKKQGITINNIQQYVQYAKEKGIPEEIIQEKIKEVQEDTAKVKELNIFINDISNLEYQIRVVPGSYSPSYLSRDLMTYRELKREGIVDNQAVLEKLPTNDRKKLINRLGEINILTRKVQELQLMVDELTKQNEKYKDQVTKQELEMIKKDFEIKYKYIIQDQRLKSYFNKVSAKIKTNQMLTDKELLVKELILMLKNKEIEAEEGLDFIESLRITSP